MEHRQLSLIVCWNWLYQLPIIALAIFCLSYMIILQSCASAPPVPDTSNLSPVDAAAKKVYDRYYPALVASIDIYTFANDAVRIAHQSGAITDEQAREISPKLRAAKSALDTARSTSIVYLKAIKAGEAIGDGDTDTFTRNFLLAQAAVSTLLELAQELGVI